jgi:hypothetical protein
MVRYYRCYFLGSDDKFKDFVDLASADDAAAIAEAQRRFDNLGEFVAFEIWEGTRKVYVGRRATTRT